MVSGSSIYKVTVTIKGLAPILWRSICEECADGIDSLVELLQGRLSKGVMERICRQDRGLFPKPSEICFSCTCPDGARMCKHVAAVLYGVGARLDERPELLFQLRAVDENDLVAGLDEAPPFSNQPPDAGQILETDDLSALFGLDMEEVGGAIAAHGAAPEATEPAHQTVGKRPGTSKPRLGHYEGRGWRGFHHHASLCIAAYGFLISEREALPPSAPAPSQGSEEPRLPRGSRPHASAPPTRAACPELNRHHTPPDLRSPRPQPAPMSMLHQTERSASLRFITQ
jgi:hypothetical protein